MDVGVVLVFIQHPSGRTKCADLERCSPAAVARFKKDLKKRKVPLEDYTVSGTSLTLCRCWPAACRHLSVARQQQTSLHSVMFLSAAFGATRRG